MEKIVDALKGRCHGCGAMVSLTSAGRLTTHTRRLDGGEVCDVRGVVPAEDPNADVPSARNASTDFGADPVGVLMPLVKRARDQFADACAALDEAAEADEAGAAGGTLRVMGAMSAKGRAAGELRMIRDVFGALGLDWPTSPENADPAWDVPVDEARRVVWGAYGMVPPVPAPANTWPARLTLDHGTG